MRTKTIGELCRDSVNYAVETLDIERALVVKKERDERRAEPIICSVIDTDIENKSREFALLLAAEMVRKSPDLMSSIESQIYDWLSSMRADGYVDKTRLDIALDSDRRMMDVGVRN